MAQLDETTIREALALLNAWACAHDSTHAHFALEGLKLNALALLERPARGLNLDAPLKGRTCPVCAIRYHGPDSTCGRVACVMVGTTIYRCPECESTAITASIDWGDLGAGHGGPASAVYAHPASVKVAPYGTIGLTCPDCGYFGFVAARHIGA